MKNNNCFHITYKFDSYPSTFKSLSAFNFVSRSLHIIFHKQFCFTVIIYHFSQAVLFHSHYISFFTSNFVSRSLYIIFHKQFCFAVIIYNFSQAILFHGHYISFITSNWFLKLEKLLRSI